MTPAASLTGKAVVVTGASRGIGAAAAVACARAGAAQVALLGRDRAALDRVADEVAASGADARAIACDVASTGPLREAFAQLDRVDVLVSSAGTNRPALVADVTPEDFDAVVGINLRGAYFAAQEAVAAMRRGGRGGTIVTVSSQMGHVGAARRSVYCATKHAVEGFTKALAVELAGEGIRVLTVAPTFVRTDMTSAQLDDPETGPELLAQIPMQRFGTPEDVAAAVVFAASDAAALMTGTSLVLDGGWTAR